MNIKPIIALGLCTLTLASCDAATTIAGDAMRAEVRSAVIAQCQQVAGGAEILASRIASVCECSADTFMADDAFTVADIDPARLEEIVNTCAVETGAGQTGTAGPAEPSAE